MQLSDSCGDRPRRGFRRLVIFRADIDVVAAIHGHVHRHGRLAEPRDGVDYRRVGYEGDCEVACHVGAHGLAVQPRWFRIISPRGDIALQRSAGRDDQRIDAVKELTDSAIEFQQPLALERYLLLCHPLLSIGHATLSIEALGLAVTVTLYDVGGSKTKEQRDDGEDRAEERHATTVTEEPAAAYRFDPNLPPAREPGVLPTAVSARQPNRLRHRYELHHILRRKTQHRTRTSARTHPRENRLANRHTEPSTRSLCGQKALPW